MVYVALQNAYIHAKTRFYLTAKRATGLLAKGKITFDIIKLLDKWRHKGFNVYCGPRILPWQRKSVENLACYTIRASFSQEGMTYHRETGQVEYRLKDRKETKVLHALEWPDLLNRFLLGKFNRVNRHMLSRS